MVLLPTNVLGDSLTLGRHIFSQSMTEWLERTIAYFSARDDVQFVIRVHPGEQIGWGPSVYDILSEKFPELPENIHLLPAGADPTESYRQHIATELRQNPDQVRQLFASWLAEGS